MRLVQFENEAGQRRVGVVEDDSDYLRVVDGATRVYDLALTAIRQRSSLADLITPLLSSETVSYSAVIEGCRLLPPLDHADPSHCLITGTGLSHLGSASARDEMHAKLSGDAESLTDSMRMFKMGLEGGKPEGDRIGVQPEWFWKGDGSILVASGRPLTSPPFAKDGGEEGEIAGLYVIADDGQPWRVGFALGNEFSDHVTERENYLYLAHSKLRPCAVGPELRTGPLPDSVTGTVRVRRGNRVLFEGTFLSGEDNMSHSIANLEHHHFKYPLFRRPGDVHMHFFGAGVLSLTAGVSAEDGDLFEIDVPEFGKPLVNPLRIDRSEDSRATVHAL